jgi:hypothetical protein
MGHLCEKHIFYVTLKPDIVRLLVQQSAKQQTQYFFYSYVRKAAVLRIHDILVWNQIRIRRSMPLTNGSGSFYFIIDLQDANGKRISKKSFFILLFEGTFTSFFKDKSQKEVTKQ